MSTSLQKYTNEQKVEAWKLYMFSALKVTEISEILNIKISSLKLWITQDKWADEKKSQVKKSMAEARGAFTNMLKTHQLPEGERQLAISAEIQERVLNRLRQKQSADGKPVRVDTAELLKISQIFKNVSEVTSRLLGFDAIHKAAAESDTPTRSPIVLIGYSAKRAASDNAIEVKVEVDPF